MSSDKISGFSDVDAASQPEDFVDYLDEAAALLAERRRLRYPLLALQPGHAVLDAGCGAGEVCAELLELVGPTGRVVGVDASRVMVDTARERVAGVEFETGDIAALPFDDEIFDAARAERVLQHLGDPQRAVNELARVIRPGGRVMVLDPNHSQADIATDYHEVWSAIRMHGSAAVKSPHAGIRLREWVVGAGLEPVEHIAATIEWTWPSARSMSRVDVSLASAVDAGDIDASDGARFLAEQDARSEAGTFCMVGVGYTVVGEKR